MDGSLCDFFDNIFDIQKDIFFQYQLTFDEAKTTLITKWSLN